MTTRLPLLLLTLLIILPGCDDMPADIVAWSPDGQRFIFYNAGKYQLHDAEGNPLRESGESTALPKWLPDSQHILFATISDEHSWPRLAPIMLPEQREAVAARARDLHKKLMQGASWDELTTPLAEDPETGNRGLSLILLYLRANHWDDLESKLQQVWQERSHNLCLLEKARIEKDGAATNLRILSIVSMPVVAIYPSPDGRYVAFAVEGGKAEARELHVTSAADYAEPRLIAARIVSDPDWTADGRSIVYAESDGHEDGGACPVASIISQQLRGEDGRLLDKFGELENLAITLSGTRIRCLDDGRIIFSGIEITLPATPAEMPDEGQLFSLDPKRHSSIVRLIPRRQAKHVDFTTQFYELSPDQKQVAIVAKEHVSVLTLATGEITVIKSGKFPKSCGSVPAWHPDGRLTYLAPAENGAGSRLVLATPGRDEKPSVSETPTPPSTPAPRTLLTFPAPEPDAAVKQEGNQ